MDNEFKKRLIDYFDAYDLVDFLNLKTEDIVDVFENVIEEYVDELEEFMTNGR